MVQGNGQRRGWHAAVGLRLCHAAVEVWDRGVWITSVRGVRSVGGQGNLGASFFAGSFFLHHQQHKAVNKPISVETALIEEQ